MKLKERLWITENEAQEARAIADLFNQRPVHFFKALAVLKTLDPAETLLLLDLAAAVVENRKTTKSRPKALADAVARVVLSKRGRDLVEVSPVVSEA